MLRPTLKTGLRHGWLLGISLTLVLLATNAEAGVMVSAQSQLNAAMTQGVGMSTSSPSIPSPSPFDSPNDDSSESLKPFHALANQGSQGTTTSGASSNSTGAAPHMVASGAVCFAPSPRLSTKVFLSDFMEVLIPVVRELFRPPQPC